MERSEWNPVTKWKLIGFSLGVGLFLLVVLRSEPGFVFIVDHANLLFHEAGHPIIGLFSERLETYGGTIGQLVFPVVLMISFWRKGQTLSFAGAWIWFFENWLNIARYMADARAQLLPLVGGGDHDWHRILTRWGLLEYDIALATAVKVIGWFGMLAACAWIGWRAWQDRSRPEPQNDFLPESLLYNDSPSHRSATPPRR
ncbi:MAG: hypothetical protein QM813_10450 [Verrucomicrobiota bacterium]